MNYTVGEIEMGSGGEVQLTPRELEVIGGMMDDLRDAGIAERLGISPRTVNRHAENILTKFEAHTRAGAVARWLIAGDAGGDVGAENGAGGGGK